MLGTTVLLLAPRQSTLIKGVGVIWVMAQGLEAATRLRV